MAPLLRGVGQSGYSVVAGATATVPHGHYNADGVHARLEDALDGRPTESRPSPDAKVVGLPQVGRFHHRYAWREAA
jgi:hypothetical protein